MDKYQRTIIKNEIHKLADKVWAMSKRDDEKNIVEDHEGKSLSDALHSLARNFSFEFDPAKSE